MKKLLAGLLLAGLVAVACSSQVDVADPTATTPLAVSAPKSGTIRFSQYGSIGVKDVPSLMALDALEAQGYAIEVIEFAKSSLIPPALSQGDVDMASANTTATWAAVAQGADIRTVVGRVNTTFYLVTEKAIQRCRDLEGKTVAFSTRQSVGYVMFELYLDQNCAGVAPEIILIDESRNRVVAMQVDEVEGAYLELEHWLQLRDTAPDKFHVLIDFAKEFPQVQISTFSARREWAEQHPETVKDFVRALLSANRAIIDDPQLLRNGIVEYLEIDAVQAQELATVYSAADVWDPNGGVTSENVQSTIEFLESGGIVTGDLKIQDVANLSYLNAVLDEIGRR